MNEIQVSQPEKAGFSSSRLERLSRMFQGYIDDARLAGISALVACQGKTIYLEKFGMADREDEKPMQFDTIFKIASMSKPITSVAAMMLYEEGHFNLNTPVSHFIPTFKDTQVAARWTESGPELVKTGSELTMRNLFTHTSGLAYGFNPDSDPLDRLYQQRGQEMESQGIVMNNEIFANALATAPLAFQPGTHWRYGYNIEILGRVIEVVSGKSLAEFMQERIFEPLGMSDTGFYIPIEKACRAAAIYTHPQPDHLERTAITTQHDLPSFQSGGGGLVSTLPDYARFCQMLVNGGELNGTRLLSPTTVALYSINHCPEPALPYGFRENDLYHAGYGYSLGTRVLMDVSKTGMAGSVGEFGWDGAFGTYFWIDPRQYLYGVMMIQHFPNAYYPIAQQFKALTYQAII
jgi:CubicO group peptidase (beta-lactamase class C family)